MSLNETVVSTAELAELVKKHMGVHLPDNPMWEVLDSSLGGRGVFARRDIQPGEDIFTEKILLVGPTANQRTKLNTCIICYRLLSGPISEITCPSGCSMPVCSVGCSLSPRHAIECQLLRKWRPRSNNTDQFDARAVRIISILRCFFLNDDERKLLYAMQCNADKDYHKEVERAAECFEYFPTDPDILNYFYRTIYVFNTNAYESRSVVDGHEILVRALFPLAGLMNHACTPNTTHNFPNAETIEVKAVSFIPKGTEITTTYTKLLWNTLTRRIFLALTKKFTCQCQRCDDPTVSYYAF